MARVTSQEVKEIIETSITDVTVFITSANLIVTDYLAGEGYSTEKLKEIERWLSAHFVCAMDMRVQSESVNGASASYQGSTGMGLDSTSYGQRVKMLDSSGVLSSLGRRKAQLSTINFLS
jgi:hypothetical protein